VSYNLKTKFWWCCRNEEQQHCFQLNQQPKQQECAPKIHPMSTDIDQITKLDQTIDKGTTCNYEQSINKYLA